ncbi:hypothetical protein [Winogradskyella sp. 3972H.M.0a.05]|uniref:hypothetical protein n=1 Tax=Winogradskyella sp. 3972H.M.0a.05 TaxID=2950277 RepID=UPI0033975F98
MKQLLISLALLLSFQFSFSQITVEPPSEGKSVIYFIRTASPGPLMNFKFFDKDEYLGRFNGVNYFRYECEPGKHLFWVKSENFDFVEADLKAGGVYFLEVKGRLGAISAASKFFLVDYEDEKQMKRITKVFNKAEGVVMDQEELNEKYDKIKDRLPQTMRQIQVSRTKRPNKVKRITQDMTYSIKE